MGVTIRPITHDEVGAFRTLISQAFGGDSRADGDERFLRQVDLSRTYAAFDDDEMVGSSAAFTFEVAIPGGAAPMGGLTMVAVRPTHRRDGLLRSMMADHFDDVREREEPLSGLWASETPIYGRFGYGDAVPRQTLTIDATRAGLAGTVDGDAIRIVDADRAKEIIPALYEARRRDRPGMLSRSDDWWEARRFYDGEEVRDGGSARRYAVAHRDGEPVGYVMYRQKEKWDDWLPDGTTNVIEIIGDAAANGALWRFLASIDLFPNIQWWNAPVDDPVRWLANNVRAVRSQIADSLWVRLVDVDRCLSLRRYRSRGDLVIGVADAVLPDNEGSYRLVVDDEGVATCESTTSEPDVELDVSTLGALYMGGHSAVTLAAAGLVHGEPGPVRLLDELMRWDPPWCPEVF